MDSLTIRLWISLSGLLFSISFLALWALLGSRASGSGVLESPALVARLDDVAMVREPVKQGRGHLGVAEHAVSIPRR